MIALIDSVITCKLVHRLGVVADMLMGSGFSLLNVNGVPPSMGKLPFPTGDQTHTHTHTHFVGRHGSCRHAVIHQINGSPPIDTFLICSTGKCDKVLCYSLKLHRMGYKLSA